MLAQFFHKALDNVNGDRVDAVIIISVLRKVAFCFKIDGNAVFIADNIDFGIFDSA